MRSLSPTQINRVLSSLDKGDSAHHIASTTGLSVSTISRIRSKHRSTLSKSVGGRPRKLSPSDIHYSVRLITSRKADNASQVTKSLQNVVGQSVSVKTVRRGLRAAGMKAVVKRKRPKLSRVHRRKRLEWAERHASWTLDDWKRVIWTDESKINRFGSDGRVWVWKKAGEGLSDRLVEGTVKFGGGNLMIWGCMLWEGVGFATRIDGRMDADLYVQILEDELQQSMEYYGKDVEDVVFQQDNDPKHKSNKATKWLKESGMEIMVWPPQSPDLNPIEHLWTYLKNKLGEYDSPPDGMNTLWERIQKEWDAIKPDVCQNLIESMPRRVQAVLKAKGAFTKY
jgi:transposase